MNNLRTYFFFNHKVRAALINGEPWFVAKDVCDCIGIRNSRNSVSNVLEPSEVCKHYAMRSNGYECQMTHVNESGMYALIFSSRKERAKDFKTWLKEEVLPSMRKENPVDYMSIDTDKSGHRMLSIAPVNNPSI